VMGGGVGIYRRSAPMGTAPRRRRRMEGRSTTVGSAPITSPALQADSLNDALWPQPERPPQASARACPAPSPDVRYGHPALRSLRVRCASPMPYAKPRHHASLCFAGRRRLSKARHPGGQSNETPGTQRPKAAPRACRALGVPRIDASVEPPRRRSPAAATAARAGGARPGGRALGATTPAQACGGHGWPRRREEYMAPQA
jgi:hypothetical protein